MAERPASSHIPESIQVSSSAPIAPPETRPGLVIPPPKPENRRTHPRTRVNYKACIRRSGFHDDVVTCEDMSKGGLCFKSRKQYFARTGIEVAVPYSPGGNTIFVQAEIAWVVEITKDKLYKCGVAYRRVSRPT
ncbi:MAG: PilZ domain-containing protein [Candidatus Acidiferrum sp.]